MFKDEPETKPYSHIVFTSTCRSVLQTFGCYSMDFFSVGKCTVDFPKFDKPNRSKGSRFHFPSNFGSYTLCPKKIERQALSNSKEWDSHFEALRLIKWLFFRKRKTVLFSTRNHPFPGDWWTDSDLLALKGPYLWNPWWMTGIHG